MPHNMSGIDSSCIHHAKSVGREPGNGNFRADRLALPHAAIVERDAREMGFEDAGLWCPAVAVKADSLNEYRWFTAPLDFVGQCAAIVLDCSRQCMSISPLQESMICIHPRNVARFRNQRIYRDATLPKRPLVGLAAGRTIPVCHR